MDRSLIIGIVVGVLIALVAVGAVSVLQQREPTPPPEPPAAELPPPPPEPLITAEEFDALRMGMPYWEVAEIIGDLEDDRYTEDRPGGEFIQPTVIEWCTWRNPDGSSATLGFDLDKLIDKKVNGVLPKGKTDTPEAAPGPGGATN